MTDNSIPNFDTNSTYETKQAARKARYEALALKAHSESNSTYDRACEMAQSIPFGQPIHVGHHSEKRDRNYRNKIDNTFSKAVSLEKKADYYTQKAVGVGGGGISSDDPNAPIKLRLKLEALQKDAEKMRATNKILRKKEEKIQKLEAIMALGFCETEAKPLVYGNSSGECGFSYHRRANNNANIRRIKQRIEILEALDKRGNKEEIGPGYIYRENKEENRIMFIFDGKPEYDTRQELRRHGFKWSPSRTAWVRQLTVTGIYKARAMKEILNKVALE